jgi:hypothetical protein
LKKERETKISVIEGETKISVASFEKNQEGVCRKKTSEKENEIIEKKNCEHICGYIKCHNSH